jgi:acyl-CoA synthetase (AMP-forming)/AMP-acid ligase II
MAAFPNARITSTYGSTEAPNIARFDAPRPLPTDMRSVPLGTVEDGYEVRLCDEAGAEVPPGDTGEICAIGPSVAVGYWKDPELTAARRLRGRADSFRTGDLGFFAPDGALRFAGRTDHMVKLRGHRFDLGEVEAALQRHPAVREAIVFATSASAGAGELLAVVQAEPDATLGEQLMQICADRLPRFAWPSRITVLAELPRLFNGKVDRPRLREQLAANGGRRAGARP